jgi:hypothetical protein
MVTTRRGIRAFVVLAVVVVAVTGCSRRADGPTRLGTDDAPLSAYGALAANWNRGHTPVVAAGCAGDAFDPDPKLAREGCPGAKYEGVNEDPRVDMMQVNLPVGATQADAVSAGRAELPADTQVVWQVRRSACVVTEYRSARLAALKTPWIPDGRVEGVAAAAPNGRQFAVVMPGDTTTTAATAPTC